MSPRRVVPIPTLLAGPIHFVDHRGVAERPDPDQLSAMAVFIPPAGVMVSGSISPSHRAGDSEPWICVTHGAVAAILLTGSYSFPLIAGLEFANGMLAAFTTPALRGVVPELVDVHQLQKANALLGWTRDATKIIGPTVAGVLVAAVGSGQAIAFDAGTTP